MLAVQTKRRLTGIRYCVPRCFANSLYCTSNDRSWAARCSYSGTNRTFVSVRHASDSGLFRLLTDDGRQILLEQRELVSKARDLVHRVESTKSEVVGGARRGGGDAPTLPSLSPNQPGGRHSILPDTLLSIVVAGEFNSGKSTLINALLDSPTLLPMGSLPTTEKLTVVCNALPPTTGQETGASDEGESKGVEYVVVPDAPLLNDVTIVDTPGTNTFRRHTEQTHRVLPEADWILFCTSADRPMPASEQALLRSTASFGKTVVLVVNKIDLLHASGGDHGAQEQQKVIDYVRRQAATALSQNNEDDLTVLAVSARYALAAKALQSSSGVGKRSGLPELRDFLMNSLNAASKVKAKLSSPLGVTRQQMAQCLSILEADRDELETDTATLRLLQLHMETWRSDLDQSTRNSRRDIVQVLEQQSNRCHALLRRVRWVDLLRMSVVDRSSLLAEWEMTQVVPHSLDASVEPDETTRLKFYMLELVRDAADCIATKGRAQGQAVIEFLGKRPSARHSQSLVASVTSASRFDDTRRALTHSLTNAVERALTENASNTRAVEVSESERALDRLQSAGRASVALCLAGLTALTATSLQLVDSFTGVGAGASLFAASGFTLSAVHGRIASDYKNEWLVKSNELDQALEAAFANEATRTERRVEEGVAPYRLLVESERTRIERLTGECNHIIQRVDALRARIDALG